MLHNTLKNSSHLKMIIYICIDTENTRIFKHLLINILILFYKIRVLK